jgi:hypothetical protein
VRAGDRCQQEGKTNEHLLCMDFINMFHSYLVLTASL